MALIYDIQPLTKSITTNSETNAMDKLSLFVEPKAQRVIDLREYKAGTLNPINIEIKATNKKRAKSWKL